jgi:hypothetical protein
VDARKAVQIERRGKNWCRHSQRALQRGSGYVFGLCLKLSFQVRKAGAEVWFVSKSSTNRNIKLMFEQSASVKNHRTSSRALCVDKGNVSETNFLLKRKWTEVAGI